jgi:tetratricopeptide (TPR) repeat protein
MTTPIAGLFLSLIAFFPSSLLHQGDEAFARICYPEAVRFYSAALCGSADSAEVFWRLARVYVCQADTSPQDAQLDLYRRAEEYALRCIDADSMISEGHTWRAAALGNIAMFEGGKTKIKLCYAIKRELERSIVLNGRDDIAYSILGSYYMALGNVSWIERRLAAIFLGSLPEGGYPESETALRKAIALAPTVIRHHFELGVLYMRLDRALEAEEELQLVGSLPVRLASDKRRQEEAVTLVAQLTR